MRHPIISKKTPWHRSPILSWVLFAMVIWGGVVVVRAYLKQREAVSLRDQATREYAQIEEKKSDITANIGNLSSERGVESEVRNRYRVVKPGERLVIVVDNKPDDQPIARQSFWQKLRDFAGL